MVLFRLEIETLNIIKSPLVRLFDNIFVVMHITNCFSRTNLILDFLRRNTL